MEELLDYLYGLERLGIRPGLETTQRLLSILGNPEKRFKSIHITGTNGKGSTTAFLSRILQEAGYQVGMYTSPHLVKFNERIQVNGQTILDHELLSLVQDIRSRVQEAQLQPTFFEFTTALAFLYFSQKKVDYAVVEVGMGGRWDATNVLLPELSIITSIAYDHTAHLGTTLPEIAQEKAGIIKPGTPVITAESRPEILALFAEVCRKKNSPFQVMDQHLQYVLESADLSGQQFSLQGTLRASCRISLLGAHQVRNALLAALAAHHLGISLLAITQGLARTRWPGRLQVLQQHPLFLIDGAHNEEGMDVLSSFLTSLPSRKVLLLAIAQDKNIPEMVRRIVPLFETVILSQGNFKPAPPERIAQEVKKFSVSWEIIHSPAAALARAFSLAGRDDTLVATGSLYFIGDLLKHFVPYPEQQIHQQ